MNKIITCPACQHTFAAVASETAVSAEGTPPAMASPRPAPPVERESAPMPRRPRYPADDIDDDDRFDEWGGLRRSVSQRPDRSGMILAFGLLGLMAPCYLGLVFGPLAWFMGSADLAAIDAGELNPGSRGLVQAGRIVGGIGFCFQIVGLVGTVLYFVFLFSVIGG
jgi:hypothetical protein